VLERSFPSFLRQAKSSLRREIRERIRSLPQEARDEEERALQKEFGSLIRSCDPQTVLLYVASFPEEFSTLGMLELTLSLGKRLICPRVDRRSRELRLFEIQDPQHDLQPGTLGILEPRIDLPASAPDAVDFTLVPGLAYDLRGHRLGRGGGYYDRLLARLRPDSTCWALCLQCQLVPSLPVEPHDLPLDGVSTARRSIIGARQGATERSRKM
jgi:5-formyltetrahydrofolate cyclo-ligase